jgi:hypothetical protein
MKIPWFLACKKYSAQSAFPSFSPSCATPHLSSGLF